MDIPAVPTAFMGSFDVRTRVPLSQARRRRGEDGTGITDEMLQKLRLLYVIIVKVFRGSFVLVDLHDGRGTFFRENDHTSFKLELAHRSYTSHARVRHWLLLI